MAQPPYQALILGHGEMGAALEQLLRPRHTVLVWERHPGGGAAPLDLGPAAARSDFVLFCLPAIPHFELATRLRPALRPQTLCVSIAKGLDESGRTAAEVFAQVFGDAVGWGVLYGPMISEEMRAGRPAFAQFAGDRRDGAWRLRRLFAGTPLAIFSTADVAGASWSAVLKNVYAVLFGVADGLGLGDNMRGYLAAAALEEIGRLVAARGGEPATAYRLTGLGDLITTATSPGSHHHELGRALARGEPVALEGEGVHTLATIRARALLDLRPYPLLRLVAALLDEPARAGALVQAHLEGLRRGE